MNLLEFNLVDWLFIGVMLFVLLTSTYAVFAKNIVRAVFSLLGTFFGVAIVYGFLSADFLAAIQLLVYVGGILVLILFAVMLTTNISLPWDSNRSRGLVSGIAVGVALLFTLIALVITVPWKNRGNTEFTSNVEAIGENLLSETMLVFEVLSIVLVGVVIGAVVIARRHSSKDKEQQS